MRRHHSILRALLRLLFPSALYRIFATALVLLPACVGQSDDPKPVAGPGEGAVSIDFAIPGGSFGSLNSVSYVVSENGAPIGGVGNGTVSLGSFGSTTKPNFSLFLPAGLNYSIALSATTSMTTTCAGTSASFTITAGSSTAVNVALLCGGGTTVTGGTATVTATVSQQDSAPILQAFEAAPTAAKVGDVVTLTSTATDPDGDTVSYAWTQAPAMGSFTTPTAQNATFTCTSTGSTVITLSIKDAATTLSGGPITVTQTVAVTCL